MSLRRAILLIGPTGSGKTPLGGWLEAHGLSGCRCHHFDFGAMLRAVAADPPGNFTADDILVVKNVVETGGLLENETFYLALRILRTFLELRQPEEDDLLIMNGLPRHTGQADAISEYVKIIAVLHLECSVRTIRERLRRNSGGDRTGRTDDVRDLVMQKLSIFADRTRPLLAYYHDRGVPIIPVRVRSGTLPSEICAELENIWHEFLTAYNQDSKPPERKVAEED